jgi:hypothetical protein
MSPRRPVTLLQTCTDAKLFAPWFKDRASWSAWFAFIAALFALPLTAEQVETFKQCTGRSTPPTSPASEAWLVCGRRAGKSFILALCAVFLATFRDYRVHLAPGERGTIMVIAADRKQSRVILRYIRGLLTRVPMLTRMVERETAEAFDLTNNITVEGRPRPFARLAAIPWWPPFSTRSHSGRRMIPLSRITRCSMPCGPAWRRSPAQCCCARRAPMRSAARCSTRTESTFAKTAIRCWCGARRPGR